MPDIHQVAPETAVTLSQIPTRGEAFHPLVPTDGKEAAKAAAKEEFRALRDELIDLQRRFYAEDKHKLLVVFQAMDAGGKDSTIRNVFQGVNPQGARVHAFKVPSKEELAHDFLWRVHKVTPGQGMIGVFNRSHYEDVLVVRVHGLVPEEIWRPRYEQINQFEKLLHDTGTAILKFYLHISPEEQRERFQDRVDDPEKWWKFSFEDLEKRKLWLEYTAAYEEMLARCSTPWAPWYVIPADQKWYRNLAVTRIIVRAMQELNPQYPPAEEDLSGVVIPHLRNGIN